MDADSTPEGEYPRGWAYPAWCASLEVRGLDGTAGGGFCACPQ